MYYTFLLVQSSLLLCQQLAFRAPFLPCLLFVFLFPFLGSKETKEKDFYCFLACVSSPFQSLLFIFVHIRRSTSAIEVYLGSAPLSLLHVRYYIQL